MTPEQRAAAIEFKSENHDNKLDIEGCAECREELRVLIAQAIREAVQEERETCAQLADKQAGKGRTIGDTKAIARAIRARTPLQPSTQEAKQ